MKKQVKKIICIVMILLILITTPISSYIGVKNSVYASEPLLLEKLGTMLVATILASMKVLDFVNLNGGVQQFYDGFIEFVETVKLVSNFKTNLINLAKQSIISSTKAKVSEITYLIKEYWDYFIESIRPEQPLVPLIDNVLQTSGNSYIGTFKNIIFDLNIYSTPNIIDSINLGYGYSLIISAVGNNANFLIRSYITYNNNIVSGTGTSYISIHGTDYRWDDSARIKYFAQASADFITITVYAKNIISNNEWFLTESKSFDTLVELKDVTLYPNKEFNPPIPLLVPWGLAMPWDSLVSTVDVLGLNIEQLLEVINNKSLEDYLDRLLDLPKSIVDAMNPAEINVDADTGVITGYTESTWDDVLAEGKEHTTILERIADKITEIADTVKEYFNPDGDEPDKEKDKTDWGNFKNFFDIFWIFYYLIILAIIILLKFFNVIMTILVIPANSELFIQYPTMLDGLNYIKSVKVGGFNITLQQIFEYMFTIFFFLFIVTTLQKLYHNFARIERQQIREEKKEHVELYREQKNEAYNNIELRPSYQPPEGKRFNPGKDIGWD